MHRTFAIGDIHGCCDTFKSLLLEKINIRISDEIYCIGDYVDRGKNSKGVIDLIISLRGRGYNIHTLRGNHEQMMLDARHDKQSLNLWLLNGGQATLRSFGISSPGQLAGEHLAFLEETKHYITTPEYVFVHAGLNFAIDDPFTDTEAMLWTRDDYYSGSKINGRGVIHGHTPIPVDSLVAQSGNTINIDAGCVFSLPRFGYLAALSLPDKEWTLAKNID